MSETETFKDLRDVRHRYVERNDAVIISGAEYLRKSRHSQDLEMLLTEARDFIDHNPHHQEPYQPDAPCCQLERRIDEVLDR